MTARRRRSFGKIRKLPSGRYQASYVGSDGERHVAPTTFLSTIDADAWLSLRQSEIIRGKWRPSKQTLTLTAYAGTWLAARKLKPRTRSHYRDLLDTHILPTFGERALAEISAADVRAWYATVSEGRPTLRSHAYGLLRTIYNTAVTDEVVESSPCRIKGAGNTKRVKKIKPATVAELTTITGAMPERYRLMVLLAAWCQLRFGELTELRRRDVDVAKAVIHVRRGVTHRDGDCEVGDPKSEAGKRDVAIPPHLLPALETHLAEHTGVGRDGLLFLPALGGCHLQSASLYKVYRPARAKAGRTDLRFHDLRHTGATLAAATGATLAELMARLGHSTVGAAMRYQHAASDRDKAIAEALSKLAEPAGVVDIATKQEMESTKGSAADVLLTRTEAANFFRVSTSTIASWEARAGLRQVQRDRSRPGAPATYRFGDLTEAERRARRSPYGRPRSTGN